MDLYTVEALNAKFSSLLTLMYGAKPQDRSELARRMQIVITDLEKIQAYFYLNVYKEAVAKSKE